MLPTDGPAGTVQGSQRPGTGQECGQSRSRERAVAGTSHVPESKRDSSAGHTSSPSPTPPAPNSRPGRSRESPGSLPAGGWGLGAGGGGRGGRGPGIAHTWDPSGRPSRTETACCPCHRAASAAQSVGRRGLPAPRVQASWLEPCAPCRATRLLTGPVFGGLARPLPPEAGAPGVAGALPWRSEAGHGGQGALDPEQGRRRARPGCQEPGLRGEAGFCPVPNRV